MHVPPRVSRDVAVVSELARCVAPASSQRFPSSPIFYVYLEYNVEITVSDSLY